MADESISHVRVIRPDVVVNTPETPFADPGVPTPQAAEWGPVVASIRTRHHDPIPTFIVIIWRANAPFPHRAFSTHEAYLVEGEWGYQTGHYDMPWTDAVIDLLKRSHITI